MTLEPSAKVTVGHSYRMLDRFRRAGYICRMAEITPRFRAVNLGETIESQGRTKRWVASQVGVHETMISHLIAGRRTAPQSLAIDLGAVLGVPFFDLFVSATAEESTATSEASAA